MKLSNIHKNNFPFFTVSDSFKGFCICVKTELVRGLGLFPGWCHRLIYITSTLCEHACKTVCDVKPGIDPCPSLARSWHKRYQILVSFVSRKKFRCCEKMSKFPLGQLQFYIFAEIVFGARQEKSCSRLNTWLKKILVIWIVAEPEPASHMYFYVHKC